MRVLICGRCCWSIHQGGIHSGNPSSLMRQVQPFCRKLGVVVSAEQAQIANTALSVPSR